MEALIQVAQHMAPHALPISAEDLQRRLDAAPFEEVDAETAAKLDSALREAEGDPGATLEELEPGFGA